MNKKLLLSLLLLVLVISVYAQKPPIKFGKVTLEELEMKTYDKDTSAPAVVLCDYGYFNATELQFTRILRIKILKKEGLYLADWHYPGTEKTDVRGITFNLDNGVITQDKLKSESVFRERVTDDYYKLRIAMPNVKVGSVLDIMYVHDMIPLEWDFQREIPEKWSELVMETSQYISFRKHFYGYQPLTISTDGRWVAEDMPAFKPEPYINSSENYITKFEFDLLDIFVPGYYKSFTTTWDAVAKFLTDDQNFGSVIKGLALYLNPVVKDIESRCSTDPEKLKAAYDYMKTIKWNENTRLFSSTENLGTLYKDNTGNSADINLMLVQLLQKLDITAHPVVLSTRDNGLLSPFYPSLFKLNYVIAYAKIGDKTYLMDATEQYMPMGLLPVRCMNGQGWIINDQVSAPVELSTDKKEKSIIIYDLDLNDDLILTGKLSYARYDYAAFDFRTDYKSFNSNDEFIQSMETRNPGLSIEDSKIENIDSIYLPIKDEYTVKISNKVNDIDGSLYIDPLLFSKMADNPFKDDERKYPVDYPYQVDKNYMAYITIPDGYEVSVLPTGINMKLQDKSATVLYNVGIQGNKLVINYRFNINKEVFLPNEYADLKELFNQIIKKQSQPIILKKKQV